MNLRAILLRAISVRDIGRVEDNRILCSAMLGKLDSAIKLAGTKKISIPEGGELHWQSPLKFADWSLGYVIVKDNVSAVLDTNIFNGHLSPSFDYIIDINYKDSSNTYGNRHFCFTSIELCSTLKPNSIILDVLENRGERISLILSIIIGATATLLYYHFIQRGWYFRWKLDRAIRNGQAVVYYQPIVKMSTGQIVGAEALFRWNNSSLTTEKLIELSERFKTTSLITRFVISNVTNALVILIPKRADFYISINVSANDLISKTVSGRLNELGATIPRHIIIERGGSGNLHSSDKWNFCLSLA